MTFLQATSSSSLYDAARWLIASSRLHICGHDFEVGDLLCKRGGKVDEYHQIVRLIGNTRVVLRQVALYIRPISEYTRRTQRNAIPARDCFIGAEKIHAVKVGPCSFDGPAALVPNISAEGGYFSKVRGIAFYHPQAKEVAQWVEPPKDFQLDIWEKAYGQWIPRHVMRSIVKHKFDDSVELHENNASLNAAAHNTQEKEMIRIHETHRQDSLPGKVSARNDVSVRDALVDLTKILGQRTQVVEARYKRLVLSTSALGVDSVYAYTGSFENMKPLLLAAFCYSFFEFKTRNEEKLRGLIDDRDAFQERFMDLSEAGTDYRVLAFGLPLGVTDVVEMKGLFADAFPPSFQAVATAD